MDSCLSVEREIDKVLAKFSGLNEHSVNTIEDFICSVENIRRELAEGNNFRWLPEETWKASRFFLWNQTQVAEIKPRSLDLQTNTDILPRPCKSRLLPQGSRSVLYT